MKIKNNLLIAKTVNYQVENDIPRICFCIKRVSEMDLSNTVGMVENMDKNIIAIVKDWKIYKDYLQ
jgi:hypothetical protein